MTPFMIVSLLDKGVGAIKRSLLALFAAAVLQLVAWQSIL
jgi:hypothetical protein